MDELAAILEDDASVDALAAAPLDLADSNATERMPCADWALSVASGEDDDELDATYVVAVVACVLIAVAVILVVACFACRRAPEAEEGSKAVAVKGEEGV